MPVALRRRALCGCARYRIRARGHDHLGIRVSCHDLGVDVVAVVGAVASEGCHCPIDLVEQGTDLGAVVGILVGQHRGDDPAGIGVRVPARHDGPPTWRWLIWSVLWRDRCQTRQSPRCLTDPASRRVGETAGQGGVFALFGINTTSPSIVRASTPIAARQQSMRRLQSLLSAPPQSAASSPRAPFRQGNTAKGRLGLFGKLIWCEKRYAARPTYADRDVRCPTSASKIYSVYQPHDEVSSMKHPRLNRRITTLGVP